MTAEGWALLVVVKQAFSFESSGAVSPVPGATIRHGDEPWGEPGASSTKFPHDLAPNKACTDVVIVGDALSPGGHLVKELPVRVEVGDAVLSAHVFGPRTWTDAGRGVAPNSPLPFSRAELRWEYAFGGLDASDPTRPLEEARNPVGCGIASDPRRLLGKLAPHVEDPANPIIDYRTRPAPMGFGALGPHFEPRRSAAGTHDERWTRTRMPMPPSDQQAAFHQVSPSDLQSETHLEGGEPVRLLGMHERGALSFDLPQRWFLIETPDATGSQELVAALDTVIIEPNELRFELVWRALFRWPLRPTRTNTVRVSAVGRS